MTLPELFKLYLQVQKSSPITVKNYVVDVNHFLKWLAQNTGIKYQIVGKAIFSLFTEETLNEYKADLLQSRTPLSTLNRRLSALRKFGQFGKFQGWLSEMPSITSETENTPGVSADFTPGVMLNKFQKQLEKEKVSPLTIKNYLSDLWHYLSWLEAS